MIRPLLLLVLQSVVLRRDQLFTAASGRLRIELQSFSNGENKLADNSQCDNWPATECDTRFYACYSGDCRGSSDLSGNRGYEDRNIDSGEFSKINDVPFYVSYPNSASVELKFQAWDDDDLSNDDRIDDLYFTFSGIYADTWKTETVRGRRTHDKTTLQFRYKLECDSGWYAYDCLCQPPIATYSSCNADGTISCSSPYIAIQSGSSMTCVECNPPTNGLCSSTAPASDGYVVCNPGWRGPPSCTDPICPVTCTRFTSLCEDDNCAKGTCVDNSGVKTCSCDTGWRGETCETDINECADDSTHECQHICNNVDGSYTCDCDPGYELLSDGRSCTDINECDRGTDTCDEQLCRNTVPGFECYCMDGYMKSTRATTNICVDVDECASRSTHNCAHNCNNIDGGFFCTCDDGYRLDADGISCSDIDECMEETALCNQRCTNTIPHYTCSCDDGYELSADMVTCVDINECNRSSDGCAHNCHNHPGSYNCSCRVGFSLNTDKHGCTNIDECTSGTDSCAHSCQDTIGSYICLCNTDYILSEDGRSCEVFTLAAALLANPPASPVLVADVASVTSTFPCADSACITGILQGLQGENYFVPTPTDNAQVFDGTFNSEKVVSMTDVMKAVFNKDLTGTAIPFNPILGRMVFDKASTTATYSPVAQLEEERIFPGVLTVNDMRLEVMLTGVNNPSFGGMILRGRGSLRDIAFQSMTLDATQRKWKISGTTNAGAMPLMDFINKFESRAKFETTLDLSSWTIDVDSLDALYDTRIFRLMMNIRGTISIGTWHSTSVCVIANMYVTDQRRSQLSLVTGCNSGQTSSFTLADVMSNVAQVDINPLSKIKTWSNTNFRLILTGSPSFSLDTGDAQAIGVHDTCAGVLAGASGSNILIETNITVAASPSVCRLSSPVLIRVEKKQSIFIPVTYDSDQPHENVTIEDILSNVIDGGTILYSESGLLNGRISNRPYTNFSYTPDTKTLAVYSAINGAMRFINGTIDMGNLDLVVAAEIRPSEVYYTADVVGQFSLLDRTFQSSIRLHLARDAYYLTGCAEGTMTNRTEFMAGVGIGIPASIVLRFFDLYDFDLHDPCVHLSSADLTSAHGVKEGGVCFGGKLEPTPEHPFTTVAAFTQCLSATDDYQQNAQVMGLELVGSPLSQLLYPVLGDAAGQIPLLNVRFLTAITYAEGEYIGPSPVGELLSQLAISEGLTFVVRMTWPINCGDMCYFLKSILGDEFYFDMSINVNFQLGVAITDIVPEKQSTNPPLRRSNAQSNLMVPPPDPPKLERQNARSNLDVDESSLKAKRKISFSDLIGYKAALAVNFTFALSNFDLGPAKIIAPQFQTLVEYDFATTPTSRTITIAVLMTVKFDDPDLTLFGQIQFKIPDRRLEIFAAVDYCWEPTEYLAVCNYYLYVALNVRPPYEPGFAFAVTIFLGDKACMNDYGQRLAVTGIFGVNPNFFLLDVVGNFTVGGLMAYFCETNELPSVVSQFGFPKGFTLSYSQADDPIFITYFNISVNTGRYFRGTVSVFGYEVYGEFHDDRPTSMSLAAVLEPINIAGDILRLTASRNDRLGGPYFYAHYDLSVPWAPSVIAVNISGYCKVLGIELQAQMVITYVSTLVVIDGWLFGELEVHLEFGATYDYLDPLNLGWRVSGYAKGNFTKLIAKAVESFIFGRAAYVESVAGAQIDYQKAKDEEHKQAMKDHEDADMEVEMTKVEEREAHVNLSSVQQWLDSWCPIDWSCEECVEVASCPKVCTTCSPDKYLTFQRDSCCFKSPTLWCILKNIACIVIQETIKFIVETAARVWNYFVGLLQFALNILVESGIFEGKALEWLMSAQAELDRFVVAIPEDFSLYSKIGELIELVVGAIIDLREISWSVELKYFASLDIEVSVTAGFFGAEPEMYGPLKISLPSPGSIVRPMVCAATGLYCDDDKKRKRSLSRGRKPLMIAQHYRRTGNPFGRRI